MTVKLIGNPDDGTGSRTASYSIWAQFTCDVSGTLSEIKIYSLVSGYAKVAIYADNGSNYPGDRLAKQDVTTAVTLNQWNTIALEASCEVTLGTLYWLACNTSTTGAYTSSAESGGVGRYVAAPHSTWVWPTPAPDGLTSYARLMSYQGWGTTAGWANIAKVKGVAVADFAKMNGVAVADIAKVNGVAV